MRHGHTCYISGRSSRTPWLLIYQMINLLLTSRMPIFIGVYFKLITPAYLCYDYGYPCLPHILHLKDRRSVYPFMLYLFLGYFCEGFIKKEAPRLTRVALGLAPFLPAAHVLLPVGTPVGLAVIVPSPQ